MLNVGVLNTHAINTDKEINPESSLSYGQEATVFYSPLWQREVPQISWLAAMILRWYEYLDAREEPAAVLFLPL